MKKLLALGVTVAALGCGNADKSPQPRSDVVPDGVLPIRNP